MKKEDLKKMPLHLLMMMGVNDPDAAKREAAMKEIDRRKGGKR